VHVFTSILYNDTSSTRGRALRASHNAFAGQSNASERPLGNSQSILEADVLDIEAFAQNFDACLIEMEAAATILITARAIYVCGDPDYGVTKLAIEDTPEQPAEFDPLTIGM
jgi:hypothetical protein